MILTPFVTKYLEGRALLGCLSLLGQLLWATPRENNTACVFEGKDAQPGVSYPDPHLSRSGRCSAQPREGNLCEITQNSSMHCSHTCILLAKNPFYSAHLTWVFVLSSQSACWVPVKCDSSSGLSIKLSINGVVQIPGRVWAGTSGTWQSTGCAREKGMTKLMNTAEEKWSDAEW